MEIYLPVAQLAVNSFVLLGIGLAVGFLSGMLGVSGGFITTPLLIFYGIPSGIAVASQASPIAAASLVGAIRQGGKKSVDYKMGLWLLFGGLTGSAVGVAIFRMLQQAGQIDFTIKISYLFLLGGIGALMLFESVQAIRAARKGVQIERRPGQHTWIHRLPFKMRFYRSALYISVIPVVVLGFLPLEERRGPRESGAKTRQQHMIAGLGHLAVQQLPQRQQNRSGTGIADSHHVQDPLLRRDSCALL